MIATAILGLAAAMIMATLGTARQRVLRAERRWARAHLLSQVAELYLLAGPEADVSAAALPEGFSAHCVLKSVENLPEHALENVHRWPDWLLGRYEIRVFDSFGQELDNVTIEKMIQEDDLF
jgi:hypothetical protein